MQTSLAFSVTYKDEHDADQTLDGSTGFDLFDFVGEEGLSQLFSFEVTAASTDGSLPLDQLMGASAWLTFTQANDAQATPTFTKTRTIAGMVCEVQQGGVHTVTEASNTTTYYFYRLRIVPRIWKLGLYRRSRVFSNQNVPQIINSILIELGLEKDTDYAFEGGVADEFETPDVYDLREYTVQYDETDLAFIRRLMEQEGIYFYFGTTSSNFDKLIITDENPMASSPPQISVSGTQGVTEPTINSFVVRQRMVPASVNVFDDDFEAFSFSRPSVSTETVDGGEGLHEEYGERLHTERGATEKAADTEDANRTATRDTRRNTLALRRKQELIANYQQLREGKSDHPVVASGTVFTLNGHHRNDFNVDLLVTRARHAGSNRTAAASGGVSTSAPLLPAYGDVFTDLWEAITNASSVTYANAFTCIPNSVVYRPLRNTPVPRTSGVLTATIAKHPTGNLLDAEGRYNVHMPFDLREATTETEVDGETETTLNKVSRPVRMSQPYSGPDYGIHFPNHDGTEAVVAFIDGDIDRPIVLGTVPNPKNHTPVPNTNKAKAALPGENAPQGFYAAAAVGDAPFQDFEKTFGETKNVIQTKRGHRLVMDDDTGTGNIGISLQVGQGDMGDPTTFGGTADPYWHSRIDLGGYRKKADFEQFLDSASHVLAMLKALAVNPSAPEIAGLIATILASQTATGNYIADTFGDTTPVGITGVTDQAVIFQGANGINLNMPNILGMWGAGTIPGLGPGQHRLSRALMSFFINFMYQDLIKDAIDKKKRFEELSDGTTIPGFPEFDEEGKNRFISWLEYEENKKLQGVSGILMSALGLPAINLNSVASINLAAFAKTTIMGGWNGIELDAKADLKQSADLDINIEAGQGIVIKAAGKPVGSPGFLGVWPRLANAMPLLKKIPAPFGQTPKPTPDHCHITIINEEQDVRTFAFEGNIEQRAKHDIEHVSVEGNVVIKAPQGDIDLSNEHAWLTLVHGGDDKTKAQVLIRTEGTLSLGAAGGKAGIIFREDGVVDFWGEEIRFNGKKMTLKSDDEFNVTSKKVNLTASTPAAGGPRPVPPLPPDRVAVPVLKQIELEVPPPDASPTELERITELNAFRAKENLRLQAVFNRRQQEYLQYTQQLSQYYQQLAQQAQQKGSPMAFIELNATPGKVTVDAKNDVAMKCLNYNAESQVQYNYKGALINGEAKGILSTKAALTKIE